MQYGSFYSEIIFALTFSAERLCARLLLTWHFIHTYVKRISSNRKNPNSLNIYCFETFSPFPLVSHIPNSSRCVFILLLRMVYFQSRWRKTITKITSITQKNNYDGVSPLIYRLPTTKPSYFLVASPFFVAKERTIHSCSPMSFIIQTYVCWFNRGKCIKEGKVKEIKREKKNKKEKKRETNNESIFLNWVSNVFVFLFTIFNPRFQSKSIILSKTMLNTMRIFYFI